MNIVDCQHRFWKLLGDRAPDVLHDLFNRDNPRVWTHAQWGERVNRRDPYNPRDHMPHPAALAWCDEWGLPDWCLKLGEDALHAQPSRPVKAKKFQEMDRWRKAASNAIYNYLNPTPFEFKTILRPPGSAYEPLTRKKWRERIVAEAAKAADDYFDKEVEKFNELFAAFGKEGNRKFDLHASWLIANRVLGKQMKVIAIEAGVAQQAVSKAITDLEKQLGFPPKRKTT